MASRLTAVAPVESLALDALWLRALQQIARRSAHELKGVLNGVSVNLEVVRSRAEKPDMAASAVSKFANAASAQFEEVLGMSDALLALARPGESPVDIGSTVSRIGLLLVSAAKADERRIEMSGGYELLGATSAPPAAARLAIAECLLAATDASAHVVCRAAPPALCVESQDGSTLTAPASDVLAVLRDADIDVQTESSVITISFPR
jgi:signal transduction histidine kinase